MLAAGEAYESETVSDLAEEIGELATDAHWRLALETIDKIRATHAEFVRETARNLLTPGRRVVGWCTPRNDRPRKKRSRSSKSRRKSA
jgi:predicted Zn-dependent peptidase